MARRLWPGGVPGNGGAKDSTGLCLVMGSVRGSAIAAIQADREQIAAALEAEAKHQDWCGPYPLYAGAAIALRAFAARIGASQ